MRNGLIVLFGVLFFALPVVAVLSDGAFLVVSILATVAIISLIVYVWKTLFE